MRRTISIDEEVWNALAKKGCFGETPNHVLRRVFHLGPQPKGVGGVRPINSPFRSRQRLATRRMPAKVEHEKLLVSFVDGPSREWLLPPRDDKGTIRKVRNEAVAWAVKNGATIGQQYAVKKALTSAGYHLIK